MTPRIDEVALGRVSVKTLVTGSLQPWATSGSFRGCLRGRLGRLAGRWRVRFNSDWQGYCPDFGNYPGYDTVAGDGHCDGMRFEGNVGLGRYAVLILSQDD